MFSSQLYIYRWPFFLVFYLISIAPSYAIKKLVLNYQAEQDSSVEEILDEFNLENKKESSSNNSGRAIAAQVEYKVDKQTDESFVPKGERIKLEMDEKYVDGEKVREYFLAKIKRPPPELSEEEKNFVASSKLMFQYNYIHVEMLTKTLSESEISFNIQRFALKYQDRLFYDFSYNLGVAALLNDTPEVKIQGTTQEVPLSKTGVEFEGGVNYHLGRWSFGAQLRWMRFILGREQTSTSQKFVDTYVPVVQLGISRHFGSFGLFANYGSFLQSEVNGISTEQGNASSFGAYIPWKSFNFAALYSTSNITTNYGTNESRAIVFSASKTF